MFNVNTSLIFAAIRDEFRILPKNVLAAVGDVAVLECSPPRGYPDPEVKWKKDGEFVSTDSRIRLSAGNLIVSDVQPEDAGRYQCLAQNMGGSRESPPAQLTVRGKPNSSEQHCEGFREVCKLLIIPLIHS